MYSFISGTPVYVSMALNIVVIVVFLAIVIRKALRRHNKKLGAENNDGYGKVIINPTDPKVTVANWPHLYNMEQDDRDIADTGSVFVHPNSSKLWQNFYYVSHKPCDESMLSRHYLDKASRRRQAIMQRMDQLSDIYITIYLYRLIYIWWYIPCMIAMTPDKCQIIGNSSVCWTVCSRSQQR